MSPEGDFDFAPREGDVGMVAFGFGEGADFVGKGKGGLEIGEWECFFEVVVVNDVPVGFELVLEGFEGLALEGRGSFRAGDALFLG